MARSFIDIRYVIMGVSFLGNFLFKLSVHEGLLGDFHYSSLLSLVFILPIIYASREWKLPGGVLSSLVFVIIGTLLSLGYYPGGVVDWTASPPASISTLVMGGILGHIFEVSNRLKESSDQKEVLIKEVHHRVKNNLALIQALVELQALQAENEGEKERISSVSNRITSITEVHSLLYSRGGLDEANVAEYIPNIVDRLGGSLVANPSMKIEYDLTDHVIHHDQLIPLGLLVNELVTNSIKHGRDVEKPTISVSFKMDDGERILEVVDNTSWKEGAVGLGLRIIENMVDQLDGKMGSSHGDDGNRVTVRF